MYRQFVILLLCVSLNGCAGMNMPQMPDWQIPKWQMPNMSSLFSYGEKSAAPTSENNVISEVSPVPNAPRLQCRIKEGLVLLGEDWYEYRPIDVTLMQGEEKGILFQPVQGRGYNPVMARFDKSGQKAVFCPARLEPGYDTVMCESIYALEDDFARGVTRTLDIEPYLQGGRIHCQTSTASPATNASAINASIN